MIVENDGHTVLSQLNVELHAVRTRVDRCTKSGKRILGSVHAIAAVSDDAVVEKLDHQAAVGRATVVARYDPRSRVRAGDEVTLSVRTDRLHVFDIDSGLAVRDGS